MVPRLATAEESLLERDVLPILTKNCMGCHGGLHQKGGLDLRTLPAMLKGGESGPAIESGHADRSTLWKQIASDEMPAGDDREKLSAAQKATIKALGIRHLNDQVVQDDSPQIRGMIKRVSHLIEVRELTVDG